MEKNKINCRGNCPKHFNCVKLNIEGTELTPEACPIGVCVTRSGIFPYAPYNYLTNAGSEQTIRCRSHKVRLQRSKIENN